MSGGWEVAVHVPWKLVMCGEWEETGVLLRQRSDLQGGGGREPELHSGDGPSAGHAGRTCARPYQLLIVSCRARVYARAA